MNDRYWILTLTRIAFLDSLILCLLCIQFVFQPFLVLLLAVIPAVIALTFTGTSTSTSLLSLIILTFIIFALFGITNGVWMVVYAAAGTVLGWTNRVHLNHPLRLTLVMITYLAAMITAGILFFAIAGIGLNDATNVLAVFPTAIRSVILPLFALSFIVWAILNSLGADVFLTRAIRQLNLSER